MFKTKILLDACDSTGDCLVVLNREIKQSKWKRKVKFSLPAHFGEKVYVRVFTDGETTVSIKTDEDGSILYNIDLSLYRDLIKRIQNVANNYHSVDYSDVFLNPWEMKLWVVGGDGGIYYSTDAPKKVAKDINDGNFDLEAELYDFNKFIPEIAKTFFKDECFPEEDEPWVKIGNIIDIVDLMY